MITCLAHVPHVLFHELITTVFPLICASLNTSLVKVVPFPNDTELRLKNNKVIITCAMTGGIHVPTMSDYLPVTPAEIAHQSIDAANAGASIFHLHARDPENGRPTSDPEIFKKFLPVIKGATDAVINITTGGGLQMTVDQRLEAPLQFKPEMCSLNMGSMNFCLLYTSDAADE